MLNCLYEPQARQSKSRTVAAMEPPAQKILIREREIITMDLVKYQQNKHRYRVLSNRRNQESFHFFKSGTEHPIHPMGEWRNGKKSVFINIRLRY